MQKGLKKGLIHIYTGDGKGKTTAAIGLGLRAYGRGLKVLVLPFLKGRKSGEWIAIKKLGPEFHVYPGTKIKKFTWEMTPEEYQKSIEDQKKQLGFARAELLLGSWDVVILDEVISAVNIKMLPLEDVVDLVKNKPDNVELIMTGRNAPPELVALADYVSLISEVKHPYTKGIKARKGIEF